MPIGEPYPPTTSGEGITEVGGVAGLADEIPTPAWQEEIQMVLDEAFADNISAVVNAKVGGRRLQILNADVGGNTLLANTGNVCGRSAFRWVIPTATLMDVDMGVSQRQISLFNLADGKVGFDGPVYVRWTDGVAAETPWTLTAIGQGSGEI